jgi:hypothetical protein
MNIWTQRVSCPWRQNIAFYERRYEILRAIEDKGLLRRFQERPNELAVRLQGPHQLVAFRPTGLFLSMLRPDAVSDVVRAVVEVVCGAMSPDPIGSPTFKFQWLVACETPYDEARKVAAEAFMGENHPTQMIDFALVIDGRFDEPFDEYHLSFGVVEAAEAPSRLARGIRRADEQRDSPPGIWRIEDLPPVAVFCDIEMESASPLDPGDIVGSLFSALELARDEADQLLTSIMKPLEGKL